MPCALRRLECPHHPRQQRLRRSGIGVRNLTSIVAGGEEGGRQLVDIVLGVGPPRINVVSKLRGGLMGRPYQPTLRCPPHHAQIEVTHLLPRIQLAHAACSPCKDGDLRTCHAQSPRHRGRSAAQRPLGRDPTRSPPVAQLQQPLQRSAAQESLPVKIGQCKVEHDGADQRPRHRVAGAPSSRTFRLSGPLRSTPRPYAATCRSSANTGTPSPTPSPPCAATSAPPWPTIASSNSTPTGSAAICVPPASWSASIAPGAGTSAAPPPITPTRGSWLSSLRKPMIAIPSASQQHNHNTAFAPKAIHYRTELDWRLPLDENR